LISQVSYGRNRENIFLNHTHLMRDCGKIEFYTFLRSPVPPSQSKAEIDFDQ
jgi:hypothetical protein